MARWAGPALIGLGAATLIAYAALWLEPLWLGDFDPFGGEALSIGPILGLDAGGVFRFSLAVSAPMALYVAALLLLPRVAPRLAWKVALGVAAGAPIVLLYTYPALAADLFDYLMTGRIVSAHGANPYLEAPSAFSFDRYYPPVAWKDLPSVYGPAWILTSAAVTEVCGTKAMTALMLGKLVAILSHWGTAACVYAVTKKLAPERALFAFVAYAWSPLALVYFAVDGHNDALMLLLLMASIYFALDRRWELSLPLLTLSTLVKLVPALLLPLFLWTARHERRAVALGLVWSLIILFALYAPLWAGKNTFDGVRDQAAMMTSSPAALASFYVPDSWLRPASLLLFAGGYFVVMRRSTSLTRGVFAVLMLYLAVLSFWTKPWYFTWTVALGAILGGYAFWVTIPGVLGLFASNIVGSWGWQMNWYNWQERWGLKFIEGCLTAATLGGWLLGGLGALTIGRMGRATALRRAVATTADRYGG